MENELNEWNNSTMIHLKLLYELKKEKTGKNNNIKKNRNNAKFRKLVEINHAEEALSPKGKPDLDYAYARLCKMLGSPIDIHC